uniref:50S ribosomal protein L10 n=1 Tax=Coccolithus braarudii TaxID=221442 RepID=A0A7S0L3T5_9EUKA|mmetsp:Transcript_15974/g.34680  ORF Transcript_15974/g.34680 Transcript_15974/m.34680 type:complete len:208 (+) Transcript_15974:29-652(+)|eukprot:CAMPEP_0183357126 /NCGR_PEP_ID=MMETSP0164_2-20130417/45417_1 /TAXON_ID=221442 /ORGANISM="Coccolithus pelagicus ssp braarudi, Strain PLY182g" /LENGTH=207 /DNA_ID=CAMNT_0025530681 /DNA_START=19 /DNA_END=642 /DNA_ORIENTATION=+
MGAQQAAVAQAARWSFSTGGGQLRMAQFRKEWLVAQAEARTSQSTLVAIAYAGNMRGAEKGALSETFEKVGASTSFLKNSLMRRYLVSSRLAPLAPLVRGQTAVIAGNADVGLAEQLVAVGKKSPNFFVLGAMLEQRLLLQHTDVERLSRLPPKEVVYKELIEQMLPGRFLQVPGPAQVLQIPNPAQYLLSLLQAHAAQSEGTPPAE